MSNCRKQCTPARRVGHLKSPVDLRSRRRGIVIVVFVVARHTKQVVEGALRQPIDGVSKVTATCPRRGRRLMLARAKW